MYHYNPTTALEELTEEAALPSPVQMRDMLMRSILNAKRAAELNREFQRYLQHFGETQKIGRSLLSKLLKVSNQLIS